MKNKIKKMNPVFSLKLIKIIVNNFAYNIKYIYVIYSYKIIIYNKICDFNNVNQCIMISQL